MNLTLLSIPMVLTFLLILVRVGGMMISSPFFTGSGIPDGVKVGLALAVSLILFPLHAGAETYTVPSDLIRFSVMAAQEFLLGLMIGFAAELMFSGIRMAGEFLAVQMGISLASVLDPASGNSVPVLGHFYFIFAFLLFLSLNIHHALIMALDRSFQYVPLGQGIQHPGVLVQKFTLLTGEMFVVALLVGIPVMAVLLASEVAMGFVAKVMPQMNVFMVSLPLKLAIGLWVMMVSLPFLVNFLSDQYADLVQHLLGLYRRV